MEEFYKEQIEALEKAKEFCVKGGSIEVIPLINRRIAWLKKELGERF